MARQRNRRLLPGDLTPYEGCTPEPEIGMIPLAVGTGPGAEERRAIAVVVIGGQSLSLFLTLIVTPVAYSLLDDLGRLVSRRASADRARQPIPPDVA